MQLQVFTFHMMGSFASHHGLVVALYGVTICVCMYVYVCTFVSADNLLDTLAGVCVCVSH